MMTEFLRNFFFLRYVLLSLGDLENSEHISQPTPLAMSLLFTTPIVIQSLETFAFIDTLLLTSPFIRCDPVSRFPSGSSRSQSREHCQIFVSVFFFINRSKSYIYIIFIIKNMYIDIYLCVYEYFISCCRLRLCSNLEKIIKKKF